MNQKIEALKGELIVSCQALPQEPLHSSYIMSRMAVAALKFADQIGFDFIGTTMVGYTEQSKGDKIEEDDFKIIREILKTVKHPVIAEGNINTPEKLKRVLELGAFCAVVGSAITRPQLITKSFANAIK